MRDWIRLVSRDRGLNAGRYQHPCPQAFGPRQALRAGRGDNKSRNEVEKTNEWKIANVKFKRKLNNDIKLKGFIINKYGYKIKSIYKQKCKKGDKKCCNFIEGFL